MFGCAVCLLFYFNLFCIFSSFVPDSYSLFFSLEVFSFVAILKPCDNQNSSYSYDCNNQIEIR